MRSRLPARQVIRATVADALWLPLSALLLTLLLTAAFSPAGGQSAAAGAPVATQQMPVGIPRPSFGHDVDPDRAATIFVDNTNDACDNESGTFEAPLCDLFRGGTSVTYAAGDVVHVFGGPYAISGDLTLIATGSVDAPVIIRGMGSGRIRFDGAGQRVNFMWDGAYGVIENIDFYHKTRHLISGHHLAFSNIGVRDPVHAFIDFNPVVNVSGHDVLIQRSEIGNNRRTSDLDSHGINAGSGSYNLWILDNEIYNNNGDAFQGCHGCVADPPHHIYIGRNRLHDDRENAVDLKTIHDVVVSENVMSGYSASATSSGDAMVVGSNGFDAASNMGPRRIWVLHNQFQSSTRAIRIEGSEDVWVVGNVMTDVRSGLQIDNKPHRRIVVAANTFRQVGSGLTAWGCQPTDLRVIGNILDVVSGPHIGLIDCAGEAVALHHNLFTGAGFAVRVDGIEHVTLASLEATSFASDNHVAEAPLDTSAELAGVYAEFELAWGRPIGVHAVQDSATRHAPY